jgi:hypothetical protein
VRKQAENVVIAMAARRECYWYSRVHIRLATSLDNMNARSFNTVVFSSGTVILCLAVFNMMQRYLVDSHTINQQIQ